MTMSVTIVGELTADQASIVLIADGPDQDVAFAAKRLELLTPLIKKSNPPGALVLPTTWPAVVQLSTTFAGSWHAGPRLAAWTAEQVRARTEFPEALSIAPPAGLEPRSYQVEGATLIRATGNALIFDEPGTGKTVTTVLGLVERAAAGFRTTPAIIVCPAAVVDSWVKHFHAWAPFWKAIAWRGTPNQRQRLSGKADIYVASYDTARRDAASGSTTKRGYTQTLLKLGAATVVADEVHKIKAHQTEQSRAVRRLASNAAHFIGLSGTPITHHPADLWPALEALSPGAWPSRERWVNRYCDSVPGDYGENILGLRASVEPEFRTTLIGQHRRVAKADVAKELPPKVYSIRTVELPEQYRKAYDDMAQQMLAELPDGGELSVMGVLAQLTRLSQMACAAADVRVETEVVWDDELGCEVEKKHQHVTLKNPSWKVDALLEVLEERCGPHHGGEQVVAFAPSKQLMVLAGAAAQKAGYRVGYVMGGQSARDRTAQVDAFQAGQLDLMCVVTQAGGVGITLTAARTAVFLQRPWSLVDALQAEDRLHRIGAEHDSIEVIDIVASKTIDTRIRQVLKERAGQLSDLVQDPRIVAELLGGASVTHLKKAS
jgi:SNF2 family DNA or RNA helicase